MGTSAAAGIKPGDRAASIRINSGHSALWAKHQRRLENWLGGLDSNQDKQIQNLLYCQLYDLPTRSTEGFTEAHRQLCTHASPAQALSSRLAQS
jgi:hypothetical protein